jgi:hypothetical protein
MFFFAAIITLSFFFKNWALSLRFFLKAAFSFSECCISLLIYLVGVPFLLPMSEIVIFVLVSFLLRLFAEIIVETSNHLN